MITFSQQVLVSASPGIVQAGLLLQRPAPIIPGYEIRPGQQRDEGVTLQVSERFLGRSITYTMQCRPLTPYHILWEQLGDDGWLRRTIHWYFYPRNGGTLVAYEFYAQQVMAELTEPLVRRLVENLCRRHLEMWLEALTNVWQGQPARQGSQRRAA